MRFYKERLWCKVKIKRKLQALLATVLLSGSMLSAVTVVHAEDKYDSYPLQSALSSAYYDKLNEVKRETDDKSPSEGEVAQDLFTDANTVVNYGNFGNVGLLYGAYDTGGFGSVTSAMRDPLSMSSQEIAAFDMVSGANGSAKKYHAFGLAISNMKYKAGKVKPSTLSASALIDSFNASAGSFATAGLKLVKRWNPAPVILAFLDSSRWVTDGGDNEFIKILNGIPVAKDIILWFGSPSTFGVSNSFMIMGVISTLMLGIAALGVLFNGQKFGMTVRKVVVKLLVVSLAVPAGAYVLDKGINMLVDVTQGVSEQKGTAIVRNNLNFLDWYATGFAIPSDVTLEIKDGEFVFTEDAVERINTHTSKVLGQSSEAEDISKRIVDASKINLHDTKNRTSIAFSPKYGKDGKPWKKENYYDVVSHFAEGTLDEVKVKDDGTVSVGYLSRAGLEMSGSGDDYTVTSTITEESINTPGISVIAAYNMMRTTFDKNGFAVSSNVSIATIPVVAINVTDAATTEKAPRLLLTVAYIAMLIAGMKALVSIFVAGIGGTMKGSAGAALGSSAAAGELIGGVAALLLGTFGMSIMFPLVLGAIDAIWGMLSTLFASVPGDSTSILKPFKDAVKEIPLFGGLIAEMISTIGQFILSAIGFYLLPKFAGLPIKAFGEWASGLPGNFASRAQQMENRFTGDYHAGGGRAGGGGGYGGSGGMVKEAKEIAKSNTRALTTLAGAGIGYGAGKLGQGISNWSAGGESVDNDMSIGKDGDETEVGGPTVEDDDTLVTSVDGEEPTETTEPTGEPPVDGKEGAQTTPETPKAEQPQGVSNQIDASTSTSTSEQKGITQERDEQRNLQQSHEGDNIGQETLNAGDMSQSQVQNGDLSMSKTEDKASNLTTEDNSQRTTDGGLHSQNTNADKTHLTAKNSMNESITQGGSVNNEGGNSQVSTAQSVSGDNINDGDKLSSQTVSNGDKTVNQNRSQTTQNGQNGQNGDGHTGQSTNGQNGQNTAPRSIGRISAGALGKALSAVGHTDKSRVLQAGKTAAAGYMWTQDSVQRNQQRHDHMKGQGGQAPTGNGTGRNDERQHQANSYENATRIMMQEKADKERNEQRRAHKPDSRPSKGKALKKLSTAEKKKAVKDRKDKRN